ncbi:MAG: CDP-diacylglycerol--serine O-phosphatidyltransferase [Bacteroidales bacterium]|nr:CDP-diacylglycerol--serine O-phosphatidyltransferase [Bacteroidales bacterium]
MIKRLIPNLITLSNLTCGVIAIYCAVQGWLVIAALFVLLGAFFDFFDGMTARLLHVQSPMGKELDSLSDVVTFGVAPGFIAFSILDDVVPGYLWLLPFVALLIPAFSSYRLAKFNIDERQTSSFIGLPTPANALIWLSLGTMHSISKSSWMWSVAGWPVYDKISVVTENPWFLVVLILLLCVALVAELPLFSLKFHNLSWADNKVRFIFLISAVILIAIFGILAIPFVMILYIILSICFPPKHSNHD